MGNFTQINVLEFQHDVLSSLLIFFAFDVRLIYLNDKIKNNLDNQVTFP